MNDTTKTSLKRRDGRPTLMIRALRRVFSKRMVPRYLFGLACLATLTALFYAVENRRGKRAWEKCRRELEAQGAVLDWNAYIPAAVPDDQNIFKAPRMTEWFVKAPYTATAKGKPTPSPATNAPFSVAPIRGASNPRAVVAEVAVVLSNSPQPPGMTNEILRFDDPAAREQAAKLLREAIGPWAEGAQNYVLVARPLDQVKPVRLTLQADTMPTTQALSEYLSLSSGLNRPADSLGLSHTLVAKAGSNIFRVLLTTGVYTAAEYLAASEPAVPDFDLLRKALERPYARMDGDYQRPYECPIPNFVRQRNAAQILSQRAQCYLLLGQPQAAWHELSLVREMCRMMEAEPASNCSTLVAAMIDAAISQLYVDVVQDGLRLRVWGEPELAAVQRQLADIHLVQLLRTSMNTEPAAGCRTFEIAPLSDISELPKGMPRGWIYQNMCVIARRDHAFQGFYGPNNLVLPAKIDSAYKEMVNALSRRSPYNYLAAIALPNYLKASQVTARNQTQANEAFIACGLERYRLAHGQYPETLDALVPQFAEKLPHDIIGGAPLNYHRTVDGQFMLYSVGWNEKDDGGVPGKTVADGDWVWRSAAGS